MINRHQYSPILLITTLLIAIPVAALEVIHAPATTPIHSAAKNALIQAIHTGDTSTALDLIRQDPQVIFESDCQGNSPLHLSVLKRLEAVVSALAQQGISLELRNQEEKTALYLAAENGSARLVDILLTYGADPHAHAKGKSPLYSACKHRYNAVIHMLLHAGATSEELTTALVPAIEHNDVHLVQTLLDAGANPRTTDCGALTAAVDKGNAQLVLILLNTGANPDELDGRPLQNAAYYGRTQIAQILLDAGAEPNSRNYWWKTPLHFAAENGHAKIVQALIDAGAEVDVFEWGFLGRYRETPLHKAAYQGHIACAQALLAAGADINLKDVGDFQETALRKARKNHRSKMVSFLRAQGASLEE